MASESVPFRYLLVVALAVVLLASGCSGGKGKSEGIPDFYVGTEGIDAVFAPGSLPNVMAAGSSSLVVLLISNKGAVDADLSKTVISLDDTGGAFKFDKIVIPGVEIGAVLKGKVSSQSPAGTVEGMDIGIKAYAFAGDNREASLRSRVCYAYSTRLTANVCIDASGFSFQKQRKPCDAKLPIVLKSQGAPVAITKIEPIEPAKEKKKLDDGTDVVIIKPKFKIFVANSGKGLIIDKSSYDAFCTTIKGKGELMKDVIEVSSVTLNEKPLKCSDDDKDIPGNQKVLSGNVATDAILCEYQAENFKEGDGTFATPLKIELIYGYRSISESPIIRIENVSSSTS